MRTIKRPAAFKKDYKRVLANPRHAHDVMGLLAYIVHMLVDDASLPEGCRDHALVGNWNGYRECHIKPDVLLIYKAEEPDILYLARLDSHAELFKK